MARRSGFHWFRLRVLVIVALAAQAACSGGDSAALALDGSPRHPDTQGVVEAIAEDFSTLTLEDGRSFEISSQVQSFSPYDLSAVPLRQRIGQFVQLGLDGSSVEWVGGVGAVVERDGSRRAYYTGQFTRLEGDRAIFVDGTVLSVGRDVIPPSEDEQVVAEIDVDSGRVVAFAPAS